INKYFVEVDPFSVVGNYLCMPEEGWIKTSDGNKMITMASHLLNLANDDYSLYCGNIEDVANYIPDVLPEYTGTACILRKGLSSNPAETYVALDMHDSISVPEYIDETLKQFMPFNNLGDITCD